MASSIDLESDKPISLFELNNERAILLADFGPIPGRDFNESINSEILGLSFIFFIKFDRFNF
mgnify:CR=1 FL=1